MAAVVGSVLQPVKTSINAVMQRRYEEATRVFLHREKDHNHGLASRGTRIRISCGGYLVLTPIFLLFIGRNVG